MSISGTQFRSLCVLTIALFVAACSSSATVPPAGGETNWIAHCALDADCGGRGSCLCGVCTLACADDKGCAAIPEKVACAVVGSLPYASQCASKPGAPAGGLCLLACGAGGVCTGDPGPGDAATARCGDSVVQPNGADGVRGTADDEECDDGNTVDGDGCNACKAPFCGNQIVDPGEACDGTIDCCGGCKVGSCGDGVAACGEACDDGNMINTDGCTNNCTLPVCGDGIVNGDDVCDDGNKVDADGCTNACQAPACGDGIVQTGEQCDDGNKVDNDACTNKCTAARCGDGVVRRVRNATTATR